MKIRTILCSCLFITSTGLLAQNARVNAEIIIPETGWYFVKNQFVDPEANFESLQTKKAVTIPHTWSGEGYGSYFLVLRFEKPGRYGVKILDMSSAFRLYLNGKQIGENGRPAKTRTEEIPDYDPGIYLFDINDVSESALFVVHVSNHRHRSGGMWESIWIGPEKAIIQLRENRVAFELFLAGAVFIFGIYHIALYLLRRRDQSMLYFGIFCLLITVRSLTTGERYLAELLPIDFNFLLRLEYLTFYLSAPAFFWFWRSLFPKEIHKVSVWILTAISLILSFAVLVLDSSLYTHTAIAFQLNTVGFGLYGLVMQVIVIVRKREGGIIFAAGWIILFVMIVNDILYSNQIINTAQLTGFGLFLFIFSQAFLLSRRFSKAFYTIEEMSHNLEKRVEERTEELNLEKNRLESSRNEIEKLNELARIINSTVDLEEILEYIVLYLQTHYGVEGAWLLLIDKENSQMVTYRAYGTEYLESDAAEFFKNLKIPLDESGGTIYRTVQRKKPFYLNHVGRKFPTEIDAKIVEYGKLSSLLQTPLIVQGEVIAVASITSYSKPLSLTKTNIQEINRFAEQIAGALHTASLLEEVKKERAKSDRLLENILPAQIAKELKEQGSVKPTLYESVSILFADFKGFTGLADKMSPADLIEKLDHIFMEFDLITDRYGIEKLKTIGDAYMCVGGLPITNKTHPVDICISALAMIEAVEKVSGIAAAQSSNPWQIRLGVHTGPVVAGVIGKSKFAYDIWGDAVNVASRMESNGEAGRINISADTYKVVAPFFECEPRGVREVKHKGPMKMYFLKGIRPELLEETGQPNWKFQELYQKLKYSA